MSTTPANPSIGMEAIKTLLSQATKLGRSLIRDGFIPPEKSSEDLINKARDIAKEQCKDSSSGPYLTIAICMYVAGAWDATERTLANSGKVAEILNGFPVDTKKPEPTLSAEVPAATVKPTDAVTPSSVSDTLKTLVAEVKEPAPPTPPEKQI